MKGYPHPEPGQVVAVWAEDARGPGWQNRVIWVLAFVDGRHVVTAIQPEEQADGEHCLTLVQRARRGSLAKCANGWREVKEASNEVVVVPDDIDGWVYERASRC